MKCFNHNAADATATCQGCGKGLCVDCTSRFNMVLCEPCLLAHNARLSRQMYLGLALTVVIFVVATYFFSSGAGASLKVGSAAFTGLLFAFTYWGWRFLGNRFSPPMVGGVFAWLMYLALKFIAAYFIGLIVGPYQIFKHFRDLYRTRSVKQQIARGEV